MRALALLVVLLPFACAVGSAAELSDASWSTVITGKYRRNNLIRREAKRLLAERLHGRRSGSTFVAHVAGVDDDFSYTTNITVGGQEFVVIADTGSSDTWLAQKGYVCTDTNGTVLSQEDCAFGPAFDPSKSQTFKPYPNHMINKTYGSGGHLLGPVGFDTVSVAGLNVKNQQVPLVNNTTFVSDGISSGLLGLAFPNLTRVYNTSTKPSTLEPYSPFFYNAVQQHKLKPEFSVTFNRPSRENQINSSYDPHLGYISFGGIPPVQTTARGATAKAETVTVNPSFGPQYLWWIVTVDAFIFPNSTSVQTSGTALVDTGSAYIGVSEDMASAFNKAFDPPAWTDEFGGYYVKCEATPPKLEVMFGGKSVRLHSQDLVVPLNETSCASVVQVNNGSPPAAFTFGFQFYQSLVVTHHIDRKEMTFTERAQY